MFDICPRGLVFESAILGLFSMVATLGIKDRFLRCPIVEGAHHQTIVKYSWNLIILLIDRYISVKFVPSLELELFIRHGRRDTLNLTFARRGPRLVVLASIPGPLPIFSHNNVLL